MTTTSPQKSSFDASRLYRGKAAFYIVAIVGLALDLGSKVWAESALVPAGWQAPDCKAQLYGSETPVVPLIEGVFAWKWAANCGAAFSMFAGKALLLTLVGLAALSVLMLYVYRTDASEKGQFWGLGLVASGAVGNLWDRAVFGWVRDFCYFDFDLPGHLTFSWIPRRYPVFNVADIAILGGAVLLVVASYRSEKAAKRAEAAAKAT